MTGQFLEGFCARVRAARETRGLTQAEMAAALGVGGEAYRAYEKRTPLPHFLIERFSRISNTAIDYLITGRREKAASSNSGAHSRAETGRHTTA